MTLTKNQLMAGLAMSQLDLRELAEDTGYNLGRLQAVASGQVSNPRPDTLETLRIAMERQGVEFAPHGWVRHTEDHPADTSAPQHDLGERLAHVFRDPELARNQDLLEDCLRVGLLARLGQEMSMAMATMRPVLSGDGDIERLEIASDYQGGRLILRALALLGDEPLYYRDIGPGRVWNGRLIMLEVTRLERERERLTAARAALEAERTALEAARREFAHDGER